MRLLLAEDEKELSKALVAILKHENYSVDAVYNGKEALDYIETGIYDGIILDIMMPEVDGLTVLRKMRENKNATPVLLLTAKSEIEDRVEGLDAGADDYLTKPFAARELVARIRAMLRRRTDTLTSSLAYGNAKLDTSRFEISTDKASARLANKEYQMLEMLMSNPGSIISQDKFMDKIWGFDSDTEQNIVWVYISYLRRKLNSIGANLEIKSHRNIGYSLEIAEDD